MRGVRCERCYANNGEWLWPADCLSTWTMNWLCLSVCVFKARKKNTTFAVFGGTLITACYPSARAIILFFDFHLVTNLFNGTFNQLHLFDESRKPTKVNYQKTIFFHTLDDARYTDYYFWNLIKWFFFFSFIRFLHTYTTLSKLYCIANNKRDTLEIFFLLSFDGTRSLMIDEDVGNSKCSKCLMCLSEQIFMQ